MPNNGIAGKDELNKIIRIKHDPSQSSKEQPADSWNSHETMKSVQKTITLKGELNAIISKRADRASGHHMLQS